MIKNITIAICLTILCCSSKIIGQESKHDIHDIKCQSNWDYSILENEITGTILFFDQPIFLCGLLSNASVAIVESNLGETIRILSLCDIKGIDEKVRFIKGDKVKVFPEKYAFSKPDSMPIDSHVCIVDETYFGRIESLK